MTNIRTRARPYEPAKHTLRNNVESHAKRWNKTVSGTATRCYIDVSSKSGVEMPTITERGNRFTSQIRLRGFRSCSKTFGSRSDAVEWGEKVESQMLAGAAENEALPADLVERAYESCGVYFLYKRSSCVYIGQSLNVHRRVKDHRKRIDFDVYSWTPVPPAQLSVIEQMYINALRPTHNHVHVIKPRARQEHGVN